MAARASASLKRFPIYRDKGAIIVNKPTGVICQLSNSDTLAPTENAFQLFLDGVRHQLGGNDDLYPVHRLDKDTTGALALARTPDHAKALMRQFQSRRVEKTYLALVRGGAESFAERSGTIHTTLKYVDGRLTTDYAKSNNQDKAVLKRPETHWDVLASSPRAPVSLLRLRPSTGYKHQLRFHLAYSLKAPILGDMLYSRSPLSSKITQVAAVPPSCMFLHASSLIFSRFRKTGGRKEVRIQVTAPLPGYFVSFCEKLKLPLDADWVTGGLLVDGERPLPREPATASSEPEKGRIREDWVDDANYKLNAIEGRWLGE